ncbi:hypothetical protein [Methylobacterium oxalidis]|uniref:Uncharacterized protein n=1 Tax=Methylobacterium oxalidis TaxID=944322 RepID=A0A512J486_9HYPH|nr:hypothetical protein [Methylobacterium oxalidis]GEP04730.1 hypothetical protein MOX02_27680 [Methylobacterium oxalidis]GJE30430.1 hypothetical protein LDDCCGHA_0598 [Methylobacterium oxalidis]GLS63556.1 hypothetical protein GCM10007888_19370 [Methylobacterium oxalidis]
MISGVPLTSIGLLRQADLELSARNSQLRRGENARDIVTVELVQRPEPRGQDGPGAGAATERRRRVDIRV